MKRRHLVVSAVNLVEGGTLAVLQACLSAARDCLGREWDITALVHEAARVRVEGIRYIERPEIKSSWSARLWFEYIECRRLSRELAADFWLAMHDMTPRVVTPHQAVYCHNAMCFYQLPWREAVLDPKMLLFSKLYGQLYRINLRANQAVIVQQDWMRSEFQRRYGCTRVIVAHPIVAATTTPPRRRRGTRFFYPSFPRVFKNFEVLLDAWQLLVRDEDWPGELVVTLDGTENAYARLLVRRHGGLRGVRFAGRLSSAAVQEQYARSDCLVFPSRLETWGLPLSEAKHHGLCIIAADLPYAHEAIGEYDAVSFISPDDAAALARKMKSFAEGLLDLPPVNEVQPAQPHARDWSELFPLLLDATPRSESQSSRPSGHLLERRP